MRDEYRIRGRTKEEGSMVVEAAMVLPFFLLFVLFLISIVQMTLYSTALQSTASDTVKSISTHMYPAALAVQKWGATSEADADAVKGARIYPLTIQLNRIGQYLACLLQIGAAITQWHYPSR